MMAMRTPTPTRRPTQISKRPAHPQAPTPRITPTNGHAGMDGPVGGAAPGTDTRPVRERNATDHTGALWAFIGGLLLSAVAVVSGAAAGWLFLALILSMGYAWLPKRQPKPTPQVRPKPTRVSPRTRWLLSEPLGMILSGSALLASMVLVAWLSGN